MSFSLFPPEINSGLIYTGPGSAPLLEAATAWTNLSAEMLTAATSTRSVLANLDSTWTGVGSSAATTSVLPYVTWLESAAATAAQNAALATQAAGLFEAARAASIPPPMIVANRALLLALTATNFFGQNSAMIATTEAQYEAMWATDGAAMDTYSGSAEANNNALQQVSLPPNSATPGAANGGPVLPDPVSPINPGPIGYDLATIGGLFDVLGVDAATLTALGVTDRIAATTLSSLMSPISTVSMPAMMGARMLPMLMQLARAGGTAGAAGTLAGQGAGAAGSAGTLMTQIGEFVNEKLQGAVGVLSGHFSSATSAISAKLGEAASMGALKVPQAWSMAADGMVRAAPVLPATTVSAPMHAMSAASGMPGGPFGNALMGAMAGRGLGAIAAKAPKVMPRSPAGG
ncbi:PPE family protein [Mycolicibacter minnesotensis]